MSLDLSALDGPAEPAQSGQASGAPLQLPVNDIDEDPEQPRQEFDEDALQELAQTIAERGVRQPVSVRPHPEQPGRWMLNFGARRLRASKLAGKTQIPAFVDETADSYDQVIENEQRQGLKPLELALFVQRRMAQGETQADIARKLGKSRAYVTFATALIEAPDWLEDLYRSGRCRGMQELHRLRQWQREDPVAVRQLFERAGAITRKSIDDARAAVLRPAAVARERCGVDAAAPERMMLDEQATTSSGDAVPPGPAARGAVTGYPPADGVTVWVELDGEPRELALDAVPPVPGEFHVRLPARTVRTVSGGRLKLLRICRKVREPKAERES